MLCLVVLCCVVWGHVFGIIFGVCWASFCVAFEGIHLGRFFTSARVTVDPKWRSGARGGRFFEVRFLDCVLGTFEGIHLGRFFTSPRVILRNAYWPQMVLPDI